MQSGKAEQMARSTPVDKLADVIESALKEYADGVTVGTKEAVKAVTKEGAKAVKKAASQKFGNGPYAKSWTSQVEDDRLGATGVIYSKKPGLPHLLENGHLLRNGKFWQGKEHIQPVEEKIVEDFEKEVVKSI